MVAVDHDGWSAPLKRPSQQHDRTTELGGEEPFPIYRAIDCLAPKAAVCAIDTASEGFRSIVARDQAK
jgi:hypothetical protein